MKKYWGYHLMIDCSNCNKEEISDINNIKKFINALIKCCKMKKLGDLKIENLQSGNKSLFGYSVTQFIHTSNITGHFMDISGDAYIDLFSCKEFNIEEVINVVNQYFHPKKMNKHFIIRDTNI
jgi:S-adenosylmethionine/arginine decarboxylase-like enzyme